MLGTIHFPSCCLPPPGDVCYPLYKFVLNKNKPIPHVGFTKKREPFMDTMSRTGKDTTALDGQQVARAQYSGGGDSTMRFQGIEKEV